MQPVGKLLWEMLEICYFKSSWKQLLTKKQLIAMQHLYYDYIALYLLARLQYFIVVFL